MAVVKVQSVTRQDNDGVNTVSSATFVSALTSGSKIVVFVETGANTTCTIADTAGNTYSQINAGVFNAATAYKTIIAWADNTSTQAANKVTATWSATGVFRSAGVSEWTGLATGAPDIFTVGKNLAGTTTPTDDSMTTTVNGDLIVSVCASDGSAVTAGTGYTLLGDSGIGVGWEYQVQSTAGAIVPTCNISPSAQSSIQSVAFKPSVTGNVATLAATDTITAAGVVGTFATAAINAVATIPNTTLGDGTQNAPVDMFHLL